MNDDGEPEPTAGEEAPDSTGEDREPDSPPREENVDAAAPEGGVDPAATDDRPPEEERGPANRPTASGDGDVPDPLSGPVAAVRWFLSTENGSVVFVREMVSSALAVALVGLLLFAVSGVWPPMVAVESGSMEPHMYRGDLVFVMDEHRLPPDVAHGDTGVVTHAAASRADYWKFGGYGDVVIYRPDGSGREVPIIHRARFWVDEGENWYDEANPEFVRANSCEELRNCPAPHAGFITKGDANRYYDQAQDISEPVRPSWIRGTAELRVPWLGWVRLLFSDLSAGGPGGPTLSMAPADPPAIPA